MRGAEILRDGEYSEKSFMDEYSSQLVDCVRERCGGDKPLLGKKIIVDAGNGAGGFFIAETSAIKRFLLISLPSRSTTPALSTSVSKIIPMSAPCFITALCRLPIAPLSSGLGIWFGKVPSGSRNWLPSVSAPKGFKTFSAKNPPAPLPASTIIFLPSKGL